MNEIRYLPAGLAAMAERGQVILDEDGHPMDVRPALRAIAWVAQNESVSTDTAGDVFEALESYGIRPPLAGACYALTGEWGPAIGALDGKSLFAQPCEFCGEPVEDHTPNELKSCVMDIAQRERP